MKPLVQLVVLGGGMIGKTIAYFAEREGWDVVLVDPFLTKEQLDTDPIFHRSVNGGVSSHRVDFIQYDGFRYVEDHEFAPGTYFMNTMPVYDPFRVCNLVSRIRSIGGHYLDISEDLSCSLQLEKMNREHRGNLIAPHCGLAPGLSTVIAANMARVYPNLQSIRINVGALPVNVDNPYGYYPTWSPEGLVNEYSNNNLCIENWNRVERVPDFTKTRNVVIEGITYESCATSGGLGTMVRSYAETSPIPTSLEYRTLRYPGHWAMIHQILMPDIIDLELDRPFKTPSFTVSEGGKRELLQVMKDSRAEGTDADRVLIHVEVSGRNTSGQNRVSRYTRVVQGRNPFLAIQLTTAFGPLLVIDSHAKKLLPNRYLAQEEIIITDGIEQSPFNWLYGNPSVLLGSGISM